MKKALICGVSGQDGAYLARLLLDKGYEVYGTSRDSQLSRFDNLKQLGIREKVNLLSMSLKEFRSVLEVLNKIRPDEVYNLAGQSSVALSFEQPVETLESISIGSLNLLESIRFIGGGIRLYNACSSECFGDTNGEKADENTPFKPRSPYAVAKSTAFWELANYREAYGIYTCSGILFNHESPLRPERFVTRKIISSVYDIWKGKKDKLILGDISIQRDWGWAPEYVEAMWLMLQQEEADDYVIATGQTHSLEDFVAMAFSEVDLEWKDYVEISEKFFRPTELAISTANPKKAYEQLNWKANYMMSDVVSMMMNEEKVRKIN